MREMRCIVFSDHELVSAVVDFRRHHHLSVPVGTVQAVTTALTQNSVATTIDVVDDDSHPTQLRIGPAETAACLINYCLERRIPMPRRSEKHMEIIDGQVGLVMTLAIVQE